MSTRANFEQPIISGFADIVSTATSSLAAMQGSPDVTDVSAAALIANAFREVCLALIHGREFCS